MFAGIGRVLALVVLPLSLAPTGAAAQAKAEVFQPSGKGQRPAVLVVSGQSGAANYKAIAREIASRGFLVHLIDGNDVFKAGNAGEAPFRAAVTSLRAETGSPARKIGVVGFSLGGAAALTYATKMPDDVAAVVAVYPYTAWIDDSARFVRRIAMPTLVLAAVQDSWKDCCAITKARELAKAGKAEGAAIQLVEYPKAEHGFVLSGPAYRAGDAKDALKRATDHLRGALEGRAAAR